jgi:hypothetical protein
MYFPTVIILARNRDIKTSSQIPFDHDEVLALHRSPVAPQSFAPAEFLVDRRPKWQVPIRKSRRLIRNMKFEI